MKKDNAAASQLSPPVTIDLIAHELGVSKSTVSLALNDMPGVKDETRRRVKEYAGQVRYRPNASARAVRTGRSHLIGVILPRLTDSFFDVLLQGIENAANRLGYNVIVHSIEDGAYYDIDLVQRLISRNVDGIISSVASLSQQTHEAVVSAGVKLLYLGESSRDGTSCLSVDAALGSELAARHLLELNHRSILFLGGPSEYCRVRRDAAARLVVGSGGAALHRMVADEQEMESGYFAVATALRGGQRGFTAIFCMTDILAVGACKAVLDSGLSVPGDISVIGYDDLRWSRLLTPPLTTIHQPQVSQGEKAMAMMAAMIQGEPAQSFVLAPRLVVRDSTGPSPKAN